MGEACLPRSPGAAGRAAHAGSHPTDAWLKLASCVRLKLASCVWLRQARAPWTCGSSSLHACGSNCFARVAHAGFTRVAGSGFTRMAEAGSRPMDMWLKLASRTGGSSCLAPQGRVAEAGLTCVAEALSARARTDALPVWARRCGEGGGQGRPPSPCPPILTSLAHLPARARRCGRAAGRS